MSPTPHRLTQATDEATRTAAAMNAVLVPFVTLVFFTLFAGDFWRDLISWYGWGALAAILLITSVVLLLRLPAPPNTPALGMPAPATPTSATSPARRRPPLIMRRLTWSKMPKMLGLFLLLATVSIAWSAYPGASALGVLAQWCTTAAAVLIALYLGWEQLLRALADALRWVLGLSFLFELIVAIFVRQAVLPFFTDYGHRKVPQAFYWSRDVLVHGGQIQGILGNSNLLAMCALLGLIVFGIQLADHRVRRGPGIAWIVVAVAALVLTRSSTVVIATSVTVAVLVFALGTRAVRPDRRVPVYLTALAVAAAAAASVWLAWGRILAVFGKSEDLTGRLDIWHAVIAHAVQRPTFGWGWVSYWAPWAEPFKHMAVRKGVTYLQAHDAWLDVWLQIGIVGLVIFALLVATTLVRAWFLAVDRPRTGLDGGQPFTALALLPLLVLAALLAQSAAESRLLVEAGWTLLVVFAVKTKLARP